ncbi:hypothetical protein [Marinilactibacillus piezotolerans]|uniref:hypothetical protein n=1 Tax=Marinilactibacillus piezotolerans TaxID=258723 RepID=UPI0009B0198A|nr:hypothetical protein [Marinilactibacillus piezotolerans]
MVIAYRYFATFFDDILKNFLYLPLLDLPYALKGETEVVEGTMSDVYFPGGDNGFVLEGEEYRGNPWAFESEPGEMYRLYYLSLHGRI